MGISNLLLAVIVMLLMAIYTRTTPFETDKALANGNTSGRYQIVAADGHFPKAFIVDTAEGKVWIVDTARIIKSFDLLTGL